MQGFDLTSAIKSLKFDMTFSLKVGVYLLNVGKRVAMSRFTTDLFKQYFALKQNYNFFFFFQFCTLSKNTTCFT